MIQLTFNGPSGLVNSYGVPLKMEENGKLILKSEVNRLKIGPQKEAEIAEGALKASSWLYLLRQFVLTMALVKVLSFVKSMSGFAHVLSVNVIN